MSALLAEVGPGDEVIMPSFTFSSTANAFVLRGATPVFVDVDPDTLNVDPQRVADAITLQTRVIVAMHYGGIGCDMDALGVLAREHGLLLVEDAAQGVGAALDGRALGAIGDVGTLSFHETKNISCGEGGALLVNDARLAERAEILQEKGTDRQRFARGEVSHYTWVDVGSSFVMSDVVAALLSEQLERVAEVTAARLAIWDAYHAAFEPLEQAGVVRRPVVPAGAQHNAHLYRLMLPDRAARDAVIARLAADGISAYFHYVPLHSAPAGRRFGRVHGPIDVTEAAAGTLVRLPLWVGLDDDDVARVAQGVAAAT
jgi:dTDP-4-amino-4,6-dideoxygalactose transaminase